MFRKFFAVMLLVAMCMTVTACSGDNKTSENSGNVGSDATETVESGTAETVNEEIPAYVPFDWTNVADTAASAFEYTTPDGNVLILGYTGTDTTVRIPETIDGLPVTDIGVDVFRNNETITHVYIPDSVTVIGENTFRGCTALVEVRFSDTLRYIPVAIFSGCKALKYANMPAALVGIEQSAFLDCVLLTEVILPESCNYISEKAFSGCTSLTTVYAPKVENIGQLTFSDCANLTNVTLYEGCYLHGNAFNSCKKLSGVTILPIEEGSLRNVRLIFENGILYMTNTEGSYMYAMRMFEGYKCDALVLNPATTELHFAAFYGCGFSSAEIPANVTKIESRAFSGCLNLTTITFQSGSALNTIEREAVAYCNALVTVDLSAVPADANIHEEAFNGKSAADYAPAK